MTESSTPAVPATENVLEVRDLHVDFTIREGRTGRKSVLRAVDGMSFGIPRGTTFGLVGESGCGKTTLVRSILGLQKATSGSVLLDGEDLLALRGRARRRRSASMQVVFQDPYSSLDPRMTAHDIIAEPLRVNGRYSSARVDELLQQVGMTQAVRGRFPSQFSGGQRQRLGIARALALDPDVLVLDEPVSALDVSVQAQVINLLVRLQQELGLTCLFIAHDLAVVRYMSHQIGVMYRGRLIETGTRDEIFEHPRHPYTRRLLSAVPVPDPRGRDDRRGAKAGEVTVGVGPTERGCAFRGRCAHAGEFCDTTAPDLLPLESPTHRVACHHPPSS